MYDFPKLIFGFKKRVSYQFTFGNLPQKKFTLFALAVGAVILAVLGLVLIAKPFQAKVPQKPVRTSPVQANPFEVKVNPFKDVKTNPFR